MEIAKVQNFCLEMITHLKVSVCIHSDRVQIIKSSNQATSLDLLKSFLFMHKLDEPIRSPNLGLIGQRLKLCVAESDSPPSKSALVFRRNYFS